MNDGNVYEQLVSLNTKLDVLFDCCSELSGMFYIFLIALGVFTFFGVAYKLIMRFA